MSVADVWRYREKQVRCKANPRYETLAQASHGDDSKAMAHFSENQGLVMAFDIRQATDLIEANPVGLQLLSELKGLLHSQSAGRRLAPSDIWCPK